MNQDEIIRMAREAGCEIRNGHIYHRFSLDQMLAHFAQAAYAAGAAAERVEWEKRVARLQSLMDLRESQPNKPCCFAEREAIVQMIESDDSMRWAGAAEAIRARGNK